MMLVHHYTSITRQIDMPTIQKNFIIRTKLYAPYNDHTGDRVDIQQGPEVKSRVHVTRARGYSSSSRT